MPIGRDATSIGRVAQRVAGGFEPGASRTRGARRRFAAVSVPFRMAPPGGAADLVAEGRGTPAQIRAAAERLVGTDGPLDSAGLRELMFDHSIGIDCAGYVRQAAIAAHLLPEDRNVANDDLSAPS